MKPVPSSQFWQHTFEVTQLTSLNHQWNQLEKSGCLNNFRIVAGQISGFREGWVFADSDAYKWLDAACRLYASYPSNELLGRIDTIIGLVKSVQMPDGYINTFNQFHFPGQRWVNLQVEHEMYCLGHLLEAIASHYKTFAEANTLRIGTRIGDLLLRDFPSPTAIECDGHQEIEIGLVRLFEVTGKTAYLEQSRKFLAARGTDRFFWYTSHIQKSNYLHRKKAVEHQRQLFLQKNPGFAFSTLPPNNESKEPALGWLWRKMEELSGTYLQQHTPIGQQLEPLGHSVRFGYMQTALVQNYNHGWQNGPLQTSITAWDRMVSQKMSVSGGLGAYPWNEGFGPDGELDPEIAYNETCAALASMFWSAELAKVTNQACYADLFEWQLYNAALVGIGLNGDTFLYNNPLEVNIDIQRRAWYSVPCCPPNLSRTIASLSAYTIRETKKSVFIDQYIPMKNDTVQIKSGFPFDGKVVINFSKESLEKSVFIRIPSWVFHSSGPTSSLMINGISVPVNAGATPNRPAQGGYDPRLSNYLDASELLRSDGALEIAFPMEITIRKTDRHPHILDRKICFSRGPILYCAESISQPWFDPKKTKIKVAGVQAIARKLGWLDYPALVVMDHRNNSLEFLPYYLWGNRGRSRMAVWVEED